MSKIIVQVVHIRTPTASYVCKLVKSTRILNGSPVPAVPFRLNKDATFAWKFDSLEEAEDCIDQHFKEHGESRDLGMTPQFLPHHYIAHVNYIEVND